MYFGLRNFMIRLITLVLCLISQAVCAVQFEPSVGAGLEYTDNATMATDNEIDDLILVGYVGANLTESEGALKYDAIASLNYQSYTQGTYSDQQYFKLGASADWEMIENRFNWFMSDYFNQRAVNTLDLNTPDNLQDTNVFTFGADTHLPLSRRQIFSFYPLYRQFDYETTGTTNNKQYSVAADWMFQMFRLASIGLSYTTRYIDYGEAVIANARFTNKSVLLNGSTKKTSYALNLGSTNVKRDTGEEITGFSGFLNWRLDLSSISQFTTQFSTDLTDTSNASEASAEYPGNGDDVQVTTDVVRSSVASIAYLREDGKLGSRIWIRYNSIDYSDNPLDRVVWASGMIANYPFSGLHSGSVYANYNHTKLLDTERIDQRYTVGGNLGYKFSRKVKGFIDIKYRKKESTRFDQNYDEVSVFASLVHGFGNVSRPTRTGGF